MYEDALLESLTQGIYKAAVGGAGRHTFPAPPVTSLDNTHLCSYLTARSGRDTSADVPVGLDDTQRRAYQEYYVHRIMRTEYNPPGRSRDPEAFVQAAFTIPPA